VQPIPLGDWIKARGHTLEKPKKSNSAGSLKERENKPKTPRGDKTPLGGTTSPSRLSARTPTSKTPRGDSTSRIDTSFIPALGETRKTNSTGSLRGNKSPRGSRSPMARREDSRPGTPSVTPRHRAVGVMRGDSFRGMPSVRADPVIVPILKAGSSKSHQDLDNVHENLELESGLRTATLGTTPPKGSGKGWTLPWMRGGSFS
jgi:hypothetical protein